MDGKNEQGFERVHIPTVAAAALDAAERLVPQWVPGGRRQSDEWVAPNPTRADRHAGSFKVNLLTGRWGDFSTGDGGGDLVSLYKYIFGFASQVAAARDLAGMVGVALGAPAAAVVAQPRRETEWVPVLPVPADAVAMHKAHPHRGLPERVAVYRDAAGQTLGAVMRFRTSDGGKDDLPHVYAHHGKTSRHDWRWMAFPEPRPLYGLDALAANPDAPVLVVEGEKCRDVGHALAGLVDLQLGEGFVVVSWPGGTNAVGKVDFSPLDGRVVVLFPDVDSQREKLGVAEQKAGVLRDSKPFLPVDEQPGAKAMLRVAGLLAGKALSVRYVVPAAPGVLADGWDLADAVLVEGWPAQQVSEYIAAQARLLFPAPQALDDSDVARAPDEVVAVAVAAVTVEAGQPGYLVSGEPVEDVLARLFSPAGGARTLPALAPAGAGGKKTASKEWRNLLKKSDEGVLRPIMANAFLILTHHEAWTGVLAFDEFGQAVVKLHPPPYPGGAVGRWDSNDAAKALIWLQLREGLMLKSSAAVDEAAITVAKDFRFHSVQDWLRRLPPWDRTARLWTLLSQGFGAGANPYTEYIGTGWLVAAVARVMDPGCKVDEMLVLEGAQGGGKSTAVRALFGGEAWYTEIAERPDDKDFLIAIQGNWCVEIGEMQSFNKAEINQVKLIVTRRNDKFRPPYERYAIDHPRQCVFVGTTNGDQYLGDSTGARRFLPVRCGRIDHVYLREHREQLWAEALYLYGTGFAWYDYPDALALAEQDKRFVTDSWEEKVVRYLNGKAPPEYYPSSMIRGPRDMVTTTEVLECALRLDSAKHGRPEQTRVGQIMQRIGWKKRRLAPDPDGYRAWVFERPAEVAAA